MCAPTDRRLALRGLSRLGVEAATLGAVLATLGCATLGLGTKPGGRIKPPKVSIAQVRLAQAPSNREIASYYCAQHVSPLLCRAFGTVPAVADLQFAFDVELDFKNPNPIPLPVTQSLFAFTAFPGAQGASNLGTVCMSFCEDPTRCRQSADACTSDDPEIRDVNDFGRALGGFLLAAAKGERRVSDLRLRTIPPNDETRMVVRLGVDPAQMIRLVSRAAKGDLDRVKTGQAPELSVPYRLEGTTWVSVEGFGRLAAGFGPTDGKWALR